jgi:hypothetical protein
MARGRDEKHGTVFGPIQMKRLLSSRVIRLQFGIRCLFVVVLLSAIASWRIQQEVSRQRHVREMVQVLARRGCTIRLINRPPLWWFGSPDFFQTPDALTTNEAVTDNDLKLIGQLPSVRTLQLRGENITDAGLEHLELATSILQLDVESDNVTDRGLSRLGSLRKLRSLSVRSRGVTGEFIRSLQRCTQIDQLRIAKGPVHDEVVKQIVELWPDLWELDLLGTDVTDKSLCYVQGLRRIRQLDVRYTNITDAGVQHFQNRRPNVIIFDWPR